MIVPRLLLAWSAGYDGGMEILKSILVVLHIVCFGVVMGGALAQLPAVREGRAKISNGLLHGSLGLLVTGLALVGTIYGLGGHPNNMKIGVKLIVLIGLIVLILVNRKKEKISGGVLGAIAGLATLNVALAVLWH
ncbi:hypothetical protein GCM10009768_12060 [Leucobacter iarius]|uniref:Integral membrane protein n=2 Tax=Leucobacter iarius TaxID=333963 RepID=A0ABP4XJC5_9MICO